MLRNDFYRKVEPQAPAGLAATHTGELLARVMKDIDRIEVFYAHTIAPSLAAVIVPVLALTAMGVGFDPLLAILLVPFLVGVGLLVPVWSNRAAADAATDLRLARGRLSQHLTDGIQGIREVLAFGYGQRRVAELRDLGRQATDAHARMSRMMAVRRGLNELLVGAGIAAVLLVGANRVQSGVLSWVDLTVVLAIALVSFGPVLGVEEFIAALEQAFAGARRLWEVTDRPPTVTEAALPKTAGNLERTITFDDVVFAYPSAMPDLTPNAVDGVSFQVASGSRVAVVGASGSGKSTLVSLLLRFWDVDTGAIRIGDVDVRDLALRDLRDLVAVVDQRTYLFNDTVANNVRLAAPDATQDQLEAACRAAALHDTIVAMPEGYDTVVGEMGERLSGGQRQRLAIARALLKDAPILVLDEATSQLDVHTEREVQEQLERLVEGRTTLVVAHRLSTIRDADAIVVMDRGRIMEVGRHSELLAAGGAYAALRARQATDVEERLSAG